MRKLSALFVVAAAAAGCGQVDPCSGHGGVCIGLRVEGKVANLEVLDVAVVSGTLKEDKKTPSAHLSLPVAVALDLPAGTSGDVDITVFGESDDGTVLATGSASVNLTGKHGKATVTLNAVVGGGAPDLAGFSGMSNDLSGGNQGSLDMAGCGLVTACMTGDGCCPSGCVSATDSDCPAAVCGNGVTESPEICDDGNILSGDGCDATCLWHEKLEALAGTPGATGHADDPAHYYARLTYPTGLAIDSSGGIMYVTDSADCTIRTITGSNLNGGAVATLAGLSQKCESVDGDYTTAHFSSPSDAEVVGTKLFVVESTTGLRVVDLAAKTVGTVVLPSSTMQLHGVGHYGALLVAYLEDGTTPSNTGLYTYDPTSKMFTKKATLPASAAYAGSGGCFDVACDAANCYVTCDANVAKVVMTSGAATNFAGTYNIGNGQFTTGCQTTTASTTAAAVFKGAESIIVDSLGNLIVSDVNCGTVVKITTSGSTTAVVVAGTPNTNGYVDNVAPTAAEFSQPTGLANQGSFYYVADQLNGLVRAYGGSGSTIFSIAGAAHNYTETLFTGAPQTAVNFSTAFVGLTSDGTNLYTIDAKGRILKVAIAGGGVSVLLAPGGPVLGTALDLVRIGTTLYAAQPNGEIVSLNTDGTGAAIYANPNADFTPTDGPRLQAGMRPTRLATDGINLFFVDAGKQIREIDSAGMVHTLAGTPATTDLVDGTGVAAHFDYAGAITTDGKYIYVADTVHGDRNSGFQPPSAIRRLAIATGVVDTIAGKPDIEGHMDGAAKSSLFAGIYGMTTDGASLFIGDQYDGTLFGPTIRQLVLGSMQVGTAIGQPGQQTFEPGVGTAARVHFPKLITFDSTTHALFVFDSDEWVIGRIR